MRIKHIEDKVIDILTATNQHSLPIDVYKCADFLGVKIELTSIEENIFGLLIIKNNIPIIIVNTKGYNENRQRFTIAHELGHFLFHSKKSAFFIDKTEILTCRVSDNNTLEEIIEKEANEFAINLLAPDHLLFQEASSIPLDNRFDILNYLSKRFKIEESPLGIKLSRLGLLEYGFFSR